MRAPRVVTVIGGLAMAAVLTGACSKPPPDPLQLEGNMLTVDNQSGRPWTNVEIWVNASYRATVRAIPAGGRFNVPLDTFVAGFGQRFNSRRTPITDLRLTATLPDGQPFELKKQFQKGGLGGALDGLGGR